MVLRYPYQCDTCGRLGTEDDGITGVGDECPDEDCDGTITGDAKRSEAGYLNLIEAASNRFEALLSARETEDDIYHIALDALLLQRAVIDSDDTYRPWEDYT